MGFTTTGEQIPIEIHYRSLKDPFIEHTCAFARWSHMPRILCVRLSVGHLTKIQTQKVLFACILYDLRSGTNSPRLALLYRQKFGRV